MKISRVYFHFFEALTDAFRVQFFFRTSFLHLIKDSGSMYGIAAKIY